MSEKTKLFVTGALIVGVLGAYAYWMETHRGMGVLATLVIAAGLALSIFEPKPSKPASLTPVSTPEAVNQKIYVMVVNQKADSKPSFDI